MFGVAARPAAAGERGNHPLRSHAVLMATYGTAVASGLVMADRMHRLPRTPGLTDVVLLGAATAKAARLLSRAKVTMIVRAPFTEYQRDAGHGEVDEAPTGGGLQRALGELLVCPYCLAPWIAAGLGGLMVARPREGRAVAGLLSVAAVADVVQKGMAARRPPAA
jgi:hypothetical protein